MLIGYIFRSTINGTPSSAVKCNEYFHLLKVIVFRSSTWYTHNNLEWPFIKSLLPCLVKVLCVLFYMKFIQKSLCSYMLSILCNLEVLFIFLCLSSYIKINASRLAFHDIEIEKMIHPPGTILSSTYIKISR